MKKTRVVISTVIESADDVDINAAVRAKLPGQALLGKYIKGEGVRVVCRIDAVTGVVLMPKREEERW